MNTKPKPQSSELDHIRDTLTDVVGVVGETRSDVKEVQQHLSKQDQSFSEFKQETCERFDRLEQGFNEFKQETCERFDKIEDTLAIIVNHLKK